MSHICPCCTEHVLGSQFIAGHNMSKRTRVRHDYNALIFTNIIFNDFVKVKLKLKVRDEKYIFIYNTNVNLNHWMYIMPIWSLGDFQLIAMLKIRHLLLNVLYVLVITKDNFFQLNFINSMVVYRRFIKKCIMYFYKERQFSTL
jgi:hypothetical protein